jgi:hypothetical protein
MRIRKLGPLLLLAVIAALLVGCVSVSADAQEQQLVANTRQTTARVVRNWIAGHPGSVFMLALIEGRGAAIEYRHIEITAAGFESYILSRDLDMNWQVARETAQFLQELFDNSSDDPDYRDAIVSGIRDAYYPLLLSRLHADERQYKRL